MADKRFELYKDVDREYETPAQIKDKNGGIYQSADGGRGRYKSADNATQIDTNDLLWQELIKLIDGIERMLFAAETRDNSSLDGQIVHLNKMLELIQKEMKTLKSMIEKDEYKKYFNGTNLEKKVATLLQRLSNCQTVLKDQNIKDSMATEIRTALIKQKNILIGLKGKVTPKQFTEFTSGIAAVEKNKELSNIIKLAEFKEAAQYIHEQISKEKIIQEQIIQEQISQEKSIGANIKAKLGAYKDAREIQYKTKDSLRAGDMLARRQFIAELVSDDKENPGLLTQYQNNPTPDLKKQIIEKIKEGIVKFPGIEMKTVLSNMLVDLAPVNFKDAYLNSPKDKRNENLTNLIIEGKIKPEEARNFLHALANTQLSDAHKQKASVRYIALNILAGVFGVLAGKVIVEKLSGKRASLFGDRNEQVKLVNQAHQKADELIDDASKNTLKL